MRRELIFARDDFQCVYCGERFLPEALTVDHVEPRRRGGDHSGGNLVTACGSCNVRKGSMRLSDFLRADPDMQRRFLALAGPHLWSRLVRTLEEELQRPARGRTEGQR